MEPIHLIQDTEGFFDQGASAIIKAQASTGRADPLPRRGQISGMEIHIVWMLFDNLDVV
jgi:hypothetical protein